MAFVLRKIRKARWYPNAEFRWLADDDLQADALGDLITQSNKLSLYHVEELGSARRAAIALAANSGAISNIDYVIVERDRLNALGIAMETVLGNTPDSVVNEWHCDLIELNAQRLLMLAELIRTSDYKDRILEKDVLSEIAHGIATNRLDRTKMKFEDSQWQKIDRWNQQHNT